MGALTLHPMKEIRVIVAGEHRAFVTELLTRSKRPATRSSAMFRERPSRRARITFHVQRAGKSRDDHDCRPGRKSRAHPGWASAALRTPLRHDAVTDVAVSREEYFGKTPKKAGGA